MEAKRHNHPLLQNLQLLATAATCAARHKRGKGSSFGQKTREENRLRQITAQLLHNFLQVVNAAADLGPANFGHTDDLTVAKHIALMQQENAVLPPCLKYRLAMRRAGKLVAEKRWDELLSVCKPFMEEEFVAGSPTIAMVGGADCIERKLTAFKRPAHEDVGRGRKQGPRCAGISPEVRCEVQGCGL